MRTDKQYRFLLWYVFYNGLIVLLYISNAIISVSLLKFTNAKECLFPYFFIYVQSKWKRGNIGVCRNWQMIKKRFSMGFPSFVHLVRSFYHDWWKRIVCIYYCRSVRVLWWNREWPKSRKVTTFFFIFF